VQGGEVIALEGEGLFGCLKDDAGTAAAPGAAASQQGRSCVVHVHECVRERLGVACRASTHVGHASSIFIDESDALAFCASDDRDKARLVPVPNNSLPRPSPTPPSPL
jgi:hypothetical protein